MILDILEWVEVPPFTSQTPDAMGWSHSSIAVFKTKTVKTSFRIVQARVKLEPRHLPEIAGSRDCTDFTGEQRPGDEELVTVPVLLRLGFVQHLPFLSENVKNYKNC